MQRHVDQNYYLKKKLSNIHLIYFVFTCKLALILAYLSKKKYWVLESYWSPVTSR
jgi:hypothetical protein